VSQKEFIPLHTPFVHTYIHTYIHTFTNPNVQTLTLVWKADQTRNNNIWDWYSSHIKIQIHFQLVFKQLTLQRTKLCILQYPQCTVLHMVLTISNYHFP